MRRNTLLLILRKRKKDIFALFVIIVTFLLVASEGLSEKIKTSYTDELSIQIRDRNGALLEIMPNPSGNYMSFATDTSRFAELVIRSEDKYFYYHPGINPVSLIRALSRRIIFGEHAGGSTLTQQLVKNLLHHENERTIQNKLTELWYAFALELHTPKSEILSMYLNTAYFGNQREGVEEASRYYFGKTAGELSQGESVRLLALLRAPSLFPGTRANTESATAIASRIGVLEIGEYHDIPFSRRGVRRDPAMFELQDLWSCTSACTSTIDAGLTATIRSLVRDTLNSPSYKSVTNAAVAVIAVGKGDEPNTLLALVGTPNPYGNTNGSQINMALAPRPIGSTWKPFIYGKAIEKGARPYTLIDDSEYRYSIGTGFAFYPKNYDGIYRGPVTLNYALSNSLNVPAVRALGFDGVDAFGVFMQKSLGFLPMQRLDTYQLSIALGGLEMNPLLLAHYFSVFPRNGLLAPLSVGEGGIVNLPMQSRETKIKGVFAATTTALISKMLTDRLMGVEQFGLEGNLNLPFEDYAVKTGTTYDYHDSWTVGYTPDVVVVVWIGNSNNKPMDFVSGARGAGKIWNDVMMLLLARGNITPRKFDTDMLVSISTKEGNSFGLAGDDVEMSRTAMSIENDILEPHDGDVLKYEERMSVPLRARESFMFREGEKVLGEGTEIFWTPKSPGEYVIHASPTNGGKTISLHIRVVGD